MFIESFKWTLERIRKQKGTGWKEEADEQEWEGQEKVDTGVKTPRIINCY